MTSRFVVGYESWTTLFTFDGDGFDPRFPPAALGTTDLTQVGQLALSPAGACSFLATSLEPVPLGLFGFCNHNGSDRATFRAELFGDSALTRPVYDTAADAALTGGGDFWPRAFSPGTVPIESENFMTGRYTRRQLMKRPRWTRPVWLGGRWPMVRGIRITVTDPTSYTRDPADPSYDPAFPHGYFRCGRLELAQGRPLPANPVVGARYGAPSKTRVQELWGGGFEFDPREARQTFQGEVPAARRQEVREWYRLFRAEHDVHTPFLLVKFPDKPGTWLDDAFLARFSDTEPMTAGAGAYDSFSFNVMEW